MNNENQRASFPEDVREGLQTRTGEALEEADEWLRGKQLIDSVRDFVQKNTLPPERQSK